MSASRSLRAFAWAAMLAFSAGAAADEEAGGWTVYPPMSPSEPPSGSAAPGVSVIPGDTPESETLALDGRAVFTASPPDGYCPAEAKPLTEDVLRFQFGLADATEEPALGLAVDCAWYEDIESYENGARHPVFLSVQPAYAAGKPVFFEIDRADFLAMLSGAIYVEPDLDIAFEGEAQAIPAIERWLTQVSTPSEASVGSAEIMGTLGRDADAFYTALLMAGDTGERRVVRAIVSGDTIIKGMSTSVQAFAEIDRAEDLRPLLDAAKLYARHLIEVNEG